MAMYALMEDGQPTGYAVESLADARIWRDSTRDAQRAGSGLQSRDFCRVRLMPNLEDVLSAQAFTRAENDKTLRSLLKTDRELQESLAQAEVDRLAGMADKGRGLLVRSPEELDAIFGAIPSRENPLEEPDLEKTGNELGVTISEMSR